MIVGVLPTPHSSWLIAHGHVYASAQGLQRALRRRGIYCCSRCGERGHSSRTCGLTDEERKARKRGRLAVLQE